MSNTKKAKITEEHREEARKLKALWDDGRQRRTQAVFGEAYGVGNQSNVGHYLNARNPLNLASAKAFATELKCSIEDFSPRLAKELALLTDSAVAKGDPHSTTVRPSSNTKGWEKLTTNVAAAPALRPSSRVPVVGQVKAGRDGYLEESAYEGEIEYWTGDRNAFALRVQGDSMHPRYRAGEFVIVSPSIEPLPHTDVVVTLKSGRKLLKQLNWIREDELQLLSINGDYAPETLTRAEIESMQKVLGSVGADALLKSR